MENGSELEPVRAQDVQIGDVIVALSDFGSVVCLVTNVRPEADGEHFTFDFMNAQPFEGCRGDVEDDSHTFDALDVLARVPALGH